MKELDYSNNREGQCGHRIVGKGASLETDPESSTAGSNTGEEAKAKHIRGQVWREDPKGFKHTVVPWHFKNIIYIFKRLYSRYRETGLEWVARKYRHQWGVQMREYGSLEQEDGNGNRRRWISNVFCREDLHKFSDKLDLKNEGKEEIVDNYNG